MYKIDTTKIDYTLETEDSPFAGLLSFAEAAEIWGLDQSTLRKAVADGRLVPGHDCRKFGKQWVITTEAMRLKFGGWGPWSEFKCALRRARQEERGY